jgi:Zn finger protein HypA/HybF involved in hydrogenase expression
MARRFARFAAQLFLSVTAVAGPMQSVADSNRCATCHRAESLSHPATAMARALERVADCAILREHPRLTFQDGAYSYTIARDGTRSLYSVSDGTQTLTVPIEWAFGLGGAGQTYVFERAGTWYESRVSFYKGINGLDRTIGPRGSPPGDLVEAAGRAITPKEAAECFACHSTGSVQGFTVHFERLVPGVQCENCHPQSPRHMEAMQAGNVKNARAPSLGKMTAEQSSEFCGRCHRTWAQVVAKGPFGIGNIRFQPYRLANSKCYNPADPRISCTACHDPHATVIRTAGGYDAACLACHSGVNRADKTCPVGKAGCPGCHMPKLELPGTHTRFSDHQIRIVRSGEPYPN